MSYSNKLLKAIVLTLAGLSLCISATSFAQSTADAEISIEVGDAVQITGIDDWLIGVYGPTDTIPTIVYNWDYQCVFTTTGLFRVDVSSSNAGNPLFLEDAGGAQMRYEIWTYYRRAGAFTLDGPYTNATFSLPNLEGSTSPTCADEGFGGSNLFFAALVRPAWFNAAPAGIYQDLVTLVVSPE